MALGSITSLGVGSGFELQSMLEEFRDIDEAGINIKKTAVEKAESEVAEYNAINLKLVSMKSHSLALSLQSNFIERSAESSKEDYVTATAIQGAEIGQSTVEVTKLAERSSWETGGSSSEDSIVYGSLVEEILTGHDNTDIEQILDADEPLSVSYDAGDEVKSFTVNLTSFMTLDDAVAAINDDSENIGEDGLNHVIAQTFLGTDGKYGIKLTYPAPDKTFSYQMGADGTAIDITVKAGTTLSELADLINDDATNPGVKATVIDSGSETTPYKLVIQADDYGEENRISILSHLSTMTLNEAKGADGASLNSNLTIDGVDYQRQSNSGISDIIQGVTLNLVNTGTSSINVTANTDIIKTELEGLVETFNDLILEIKQNSQISDSDDEETGVLAYSSSIKNIVNELGTYFASVIDNSGTLNNIFDIGIDIDLRADILTDADGNEYYNGVTLDNAVLDKILSTDLESLTQLFTTDLDTGEKGLGDLIHDGLRDLSGLNGSLRLKKTSAESKITMLEASIDAETERLDKRYDLLARDFVRLDSYIGRLNSQGDYLKSMFDSFSSSSSAG